MDHVPGRSSRSSSELIAAAPFAVLFSVAADEVID